MNDCHVNIAVSWSKHDFTSCEIDHSECHCGCGRHLGSQICQARSPYQNLGATDPRPPVSRDPCLAVLNLSLNVQCYKGSSFACKPSESENHTSQIMANSWAQYGIDLPGSLHTNKIPVILGRYPLPRFFCRLSIVPLDMDNGTFNSSHTDVVEKVNFLVPASQHGGTSVAEGSP